MEDPGRNRRPADTWSRTSHPKNTCILDPVSKASPVLPPWCHGHQFQSTFSIMPALQGGSPGGGGGSSPVKTSLTAFAKEAAITGKQGEPPGLWLCVSVTVSS